MKKWMFVIAPGLMLAGFVVLYFSHAEEMHKKQIAQKAKVEQERVAADEKKKVAETKAREDAKKRQEERDTEEKKKLDEKMARQAADDKKVRDQTTEYTAKADAAAKQVVALETELDRLRKEKDKTNREAFDLAKQVELARIARRNAELEIQRMTEMVSRRAAESSMTKPPVLPPPPPAKS
jgi:hypothetical protein